MVRRLPGQSLRDEKERLTDKWLLPCYFVPVYGWAMWLVELWRAHAHEPPHPNMLLCAAILSTGVSAIVFGRLLPRFRNLNRGERGELKVAELLEGLRATGYRAFHDLRRDGYNIDHVVVGPSGVFVIETKFRSGYGEIEFRNGQGLFVGGRQEENDPLLQARRNARDLNQLIREDCGIDRWVSPLVVFVGDWRIKNRWRETDARVLTANQVPGYFSDRQPELTRAEIKLIASHLERSAKA